MKTLNELAIEYKTTKNKETLNQIFVSLQKTIKEKTTHTFYKRKFVRAMIDVEVMNDEGTKKIMKRLPQCFTLYGTKLIELEDVEQELNLEILNIIERYDISRPFDKFLYSSIWLWQPNFVNKDFINQLSNISLSTAEGEGQYNEELINNLSVMPQFDESFDVRELFTNLTETEEKLLNILKNNSGLKQAQLVKIMGVTKQRISQLFKSIQKKYISPLDF